MRAATCILLLALACSTVRDERPIGGSEPPPPTPIAASQGYDEAVKVGAAWAQNQGYQAQLAEARQGSGHLWVLRYGLVRNGRFGHVRLSVDAATSKVTQVEEEPLEIARPPAEQKGH